MRLATSSLCRECFSEEPPRNGRCARCGSPRVVIHPELNRLAIAHIDCDAFFASVEKRDRPELRDKPVIIGGGRRGVVATACYIARISGVRSAMPMFKALQLCPSAVVIPPNGEKYRAVGREIRARMMALTPLVEACSIDEAFLDLSGSERLHRGSPARTLAQFAQAVHAEVGVTVSIGLSYCKFLAKLASDMDKPRGFACIGAEEAAQMLAPMPISRIWGVGAAANQRLEKNGLRLIGEIQARDEAEMLKTLGKEGGRLWRLARGMDARPVSPDRPVKSVSHEITFDEDTGDLEILTPRLLSLCEKTSARLKEKGLAGRSVTLKLKTAQFKTRTRARAVPATQLAARIFPIARDLLRQEAKGEKYRLIGVGVSDLTAAEDADSPDLAEPDGEKIKAAESAIDRVRRKFGDQAIMRGIVYAHPPRR